MEDIKEKTADEIRKIAQEELVKQIRENIDSALIFSYINQLEQENKQLKSKIKQIRDKAECMDYYCLNDVIDDLNRLLGDDK